MEIIKDSYKEALLLIERLHRQFLDVIKNYLEHLKVDDINNVQALILHNIGEEQLTIGELTHRGYYLGSNVSYNVKKMVEAGYLIQEQAVHDKRSSKVRLTEKGLELFHSIDQFYEKISADFGSRHGLLDELKEANQLLIQLESHLARYAFDITRLS
jgi:DNA-binding MarR family transcriptional regulator